MATELAEPRRTRHRLVTPHGQRHLRQLRRALTSGRITRMEMVPWGTNGTFAVLLEQDLAPGLIGIYKPARGEAPLWDFPAGTLYKREFASYVLSRCLGWSFIPPTVIRDGPYGIGTIQLFVEPDDRPLRDPAVRTQLQRIALFDLLTNNADRKASHLFVGRYDRRVWGIDHGLTFHTDPKLRTVLWDFCGEPIPQPLQEALRRLLRHRRRVQRVLAPFLSAEELAVFWHRCRALLTRPLFPHLNPRRNIPYGW
ncbi:MAG: SCO1664 family protein [Thermomicrobium sp.]|nr:SCO1664 family protein [Thermomicrobium sp.]MDW7981344.1 SCO1664 family protein [Thermomicrobium sp.]